MPTAVVMPIAAIVRRERPAGRSSRATAVASGTRPSPAPCRARPARNTANPAGSADSTQPASITATAPTVARRRSRPSPRRPRTGVTTAPASSVIVSVHCEAASDTCSACWTAGSSGVPRLATAVDSTARNTSTAASRVSGTLRLRGADMVVGIAFTLGRLTHAVQDQNSHVLMHLVHKVAVVDLLQLRYFQAVARHQHVSRAATELRVAQPALSRSIARLEAELGVVLFDRHGRRVRLNRFGVLFLARVQNALAELDQARQEVRDAAGLSRGTVAVAVETLRMVTELAAGFLADHPEVSLRLYQSPAPVMSAQLQAAEILSEEVLLAVPPGHRLARRARTGVEELAGEPFVTTRPGYWQRALTDRLFNAAGIQPTIVCEGDEPYAVRSLISAGVGVGLIPAVARRVAPHPLVAWLHLDAPGCRRTLSLVWRTDAYRSAAARAFTE